MKTLEAMYKFVTAFLRILNVVIYILIYFSNFYVQVIWDSFYMGRIV